MAASPSVSTGIFESLFFLYLVIALVVGGLVIGWLFYSLWRYRARPGAARPRDAPVAGVLPAERGRVIWSWSLAAGIAAIMFGLAFTTIDAVNAIEHPPEDRVWNHHNVTGFQFGWRYNYTGAGGIPFSKVNEWTVPVDAVVVMNVTSQDVWHNFAITDFRIRVDAIPGEVNRLWFEAHETGDFGNVCVQLCGSSHAVMRTTMHVVAQAEYDAWLADQSAAEYAKLAGAIVKDPKRGALVEARVNAGGVAADATEVVAGRPVMLNVTNEGDAPVTVAVSAAGASNGLTIAPGAVGRLWIQAPAAGEVVLSTSIGPSATFKVVSP